MRRLADQMSIFLLMIALSLVGVGLVRAQSPDATIARVDERVNAVDKRVEKIETTMGYGMAALIANLVAHLFQIRTNLHGRRRRGQDDD